MPENSDGDKNTQWSWHDITENVVVGTITTIAVSGLGLIVSRFASLPATYLSALIGFGAGIVLVSLRLRFAARIIVGLVIGVALIFPSQFVSSHQPGHKSNGPNGSTHSSPEGSGKSSIQPVFVIDLDYRSDQSERLWRALLRSMD